jgi:hypothetical protein
METLMQALPSNPEPPARLGALQLALYNSVLSIAKAFDDSVETLDPRRASVTLLNFMRANPGLDERQARRAADALVARRILKVSKIGWSLADLEYERLLQQRVRELTGPNT